jgi:hypothetical protein
MIRMGLAVMFAFCSLAFGSLPAGADDKKDDKKDEKKETLPHLGQWSREVENFGLNFKFEKEKMTVDVTVGENGITVICSYTIDKDGKVSGEVTEVKEKGNFPTKPEKGSKITFKIKVDDKKATISDFEVPDGEAAKAVVEGEYKKKVD